MNQRDAHGRPIKPKMLGRAWTQEDLANLSESLVTIAHEEGPGHALELLDHGYVSTSMNANIYDSLKKMILDSQAGKKQ